MAKLPPERSPLAVGLEWSVTIMVIGAEMVVPGLAGYWIDTKLGTRAVFLFAGLALGSLIAGLALARIARNRPEGKQQKRPGQ